LPGNNALASRYMLLGQSEMLFEHFAHPASLHGLSGDGERCAGGINSRVPADHPFEAHNAKAVQRRRPPADRSSNAPAVAAAKPSGCINAERAPGFALNSGSPAAADRSSSVPTKWKGVRRRVYAAHSIVEASLSVLLARRRS
jgi:hypothetical protein